MPITHFERELLQRLSEEEWTSPPLFDQGMVARLVDGGYVRAILLGGGRVQYELTNNGRAALRE